MFKKVIPKRDEDGKVITQERNFYTTRQKAGKAEDAYFAPGTYNCRGDVYKDPKIFGRMKTKDGWKLAGHDINFKPAKAVHVKVDKNLPFKYIEDPPKYKKAQKDDDGKVITEERNFYTCGPKKGRVGFGTHFNPIPKWIPEDPNYEKNQIKKQLKI